jgi:serine/threonine protein kinase/tetratricopeptide (TPR) repeat protein
VSEQQFHHTDRIASDVETNVDFAPGQILGGRYKVLSLLGRGGMGVVYRVEQIFLGKELALKTMNKSSITDVTIRRFQAEARAAFAVDHPNIISVHDFGLLDDQTPFLAMEIIHGETLGAHLKNRVLSVDEAIPIFIQVCFGLAHAHANGVVHRDIKPNNIMLLDQVKHGTEGSVKILDFGIAKLTLNDGGEIQALTRTGEIFGSPLYMSPEQCTGEKVDHRSDIYSVGCVLFETLTGRPPIIGESALTTMMMHQSAIAPSLKEASPGASFPPELENVVKLMLAKQPGQRYQDLGRAALDLAAIKRGETPKSTIAPAFKRPVDQKRENPNITMGRSKFYLLLCTVALTVSLITTASMFAVFPSHKINVWLPKKTVELKNDNDMPHELAGISKSTFDSPIKKGACRFVLEQLATDESLHSFQDYKGAQQLGLEKCDVTDAGMANLIGSKLLSLELKACDAVKTVDNISKLSYLNNLDLSWTGIDDSAMSKLAKLKMLRTLDITGCEISEQGLKQLIPSTSLTTVCVTKDKFSKKFLGELQNKMPQCAFPPDIQFSKLDQIAQNDTTRSADQKLINLKEIAEKANPLSTRAAQYMLQMGDIKNGQGKQDEAGKYLHDATEVLKKNGDLSLLAYVYCSEAGLALVQKRFSESADLNGLSEKLFIDTLYHDDPQLIKNLQNLAWLANDAKNRPMAISHYQDALRFVELYPRQLKPPLARDLNEQIGWLNYCSGDRNHALPYLEKYMELCKKDQDQDPKSYARSLIEVGHCRPDVKSQKEFYDQGLVLIEKLGFPKDINLQQHYEDACRDLATIYDAESNPQESIKYLRKALAVANLDNSNPDDRSGLFSNLLAEHEKKLKRLN